MSSIYTPASQVLERHGDDFSNRNILFAGDIQDNFPAFINANNVNVHCHSYHHYQALSGLLNGEVEFSVVPKPALFNQVDTLIYYWPKSKQEAQFQISALLSQLNKGADIFIVGENRSGVRSAENLLAPFGIIKKIDSARRCSLYHFQAQSRLGFDINEWWQTYQLENGVVVKSLPGVFSASHLDVGSELLLNALLDSPKLLQGNVLDMGSGAGVLSAVIGSQCSELTLTLADVNAAALMSSEATLKANNLTGQVIASDVFSNISGKFDLIISNPPFHDGKETSYFAAESLIREAKKHLNINGRICIVANAFLPYPDLLDKAFGRHQLLLQTGKFKVYLAG